MSIILYTSLFNEQNIYRKQELDLCLAKHICNPLISKIILVADETVPENMHFAFEKVIIHRLGKRPTFADFFYSVIPKYSDEEDINIVCNSDVYCDDTISKLKYVRWDCNIALALSRWDKPYLMKDLMPDTLKDSRDYVCYPQRDSQDVWILQGHPKGMYANFNLGNPGSDNRIAHEMDEAGYWVFNPAQDIRFYHIHESPQRSYTRQDQVPPPYKLLYPTDLSPLKLRHPKKILHIGMYAFLNAEGSIGAGLQSNGDYDFINWVDYTKDWILTKPKAFEEDILRKIVDKDIVFMQLQTDNIVNLELVKKMKQYNNKVTIYNWSGDVREDIPKCFMDIATETVSLFTNATDVGKMRELGLNSEYLQIGFPENIYNPKGYVNKEAEPIVFMGNNYYDLKNGKHGFPLGKERQDMAFYLKKTYGDKFGLYGNGWSGLESGACVNDGIKESAIYRGAKMAINYSHFNYSRYSSDRLLRIMGSGCFCISHRYPDIEKDFTIGTHLVVFDTMEQLKTVIDYYMEHEDERIRIAKSGCEFVHKTATWEKRISELLKMKI